MRIKQGFVLREVAGQAVVVPTGEASRDFNGMVKLNETGRAVWEGLAAGKDDAQIAQGLAQAYDVSVEQAAADVASFVETARRRGFLA